MRRAKLRRVVVVPAALPAAPQQQPDLEPAVRAAYDKAFGVSTARQRLTVGRRGAEHEYALHAPDEVIGAIVTGTWAGPADPRSGATPGQDRAASELLWLCIWEGRERRVLLATDLELAQRLVARYQGCYLPAQVEVHHCDLPSGSLYFAGRLGGE